MSTPDEVQARLAAIVATSDDAIVSKDLNGIVQSWNAAAERIFGYTAAEMIGQPILKIIPPERLDEEPRILERLGRGERVDHFETVRLRKDGRRIDISVTISPIRDATGKVVGASKIARDISEIRRAARERERIHELGRTMARETDIHKLVQAITDAATELSGAQFGAFFYNVVNDAGESYMLYTLSGVSREHFANFPMPRNTEVFGPTFTGAGIVRSDDITKDPRYGKNAPRHGMPEGHLPVRSYLAVPVVARSGEVLGGLFFGHSEVGVFNAQAEAIVTGIAGNASVALENAKLQRELQENLQRFQSLANTIPQLAWMCKPDGSIFWYNARWYEYTGETPETQLGQGWEKVHDPKELPRVRKRWQTAVAAGEPWEDTFPLRRRDGVMRWHLSRAEPVKDSSGKVIMWFGTNTDITEQQTIAKEKEELLAAERAARSEAERVNRMKDEFLSTLSHELRTPLNAILGWSQLIQRGKGDPETLNEGLTVIERNARVQTQLIEDLLDMSRIISGKVRLDVQRLDPATVLEAAIASVQPSADAKGIRIVKVLDPLAGPVAGDPNRLQQVAWNLLNNAIKFTPKGGKVTVLLERVNSHIEFTVADTGQGIKAEFLPYVFDRFRQGDATTTRHHGGLGLGLAIVKHLVELHGGKVRVKSAGEGQGATFSVEIPVVAARQEEDREHPASPNFSATGACEQIALDRLKVLVVDDEADARELLRRLLTECKAEVLLADSVNAAMEMVKRQRPDVIISDIGMPDRDGYELIKDVRRLPAGEGGKIPAIALTAFARSEDRMRALMAGYQAHIAKPVEPQELIVTVASVGGRMGR
ncbi:MAG: PAS domain S-box protein [Phycisphaerae bacterium]